MVENGLWNRFKYIELVEIMCQKDDSPFAIALNNMKQFHVKLVYKPDNMGNVDNLHQRKIVTVLKVAVKSNS